MTTRTELESALKDAMRANDDVRKRTLRMVISAIKLAEIDKGAALDETATASILQKEIKSRHESIADAQKASRPEIIEAARQEIAVLECYLPQALSPQELEEIAQAVIAELGATSIKEMGQVMKALMARLQGRASGNDANQVVRRLLQ
jgi:hypothetical protein